MKRRKDGESMYQCPGCGGNLKFNVEKQKLYCENCSYAVDPLEAKDVKAAEEEQLSDEEYEVTVFRCPQCGAEILSEDTTAATFCSFCCSSTVLESRVTKEKKPAYILPFKKTKEDCKNAYENMMKKALFVPKEYKDPAYIEKFRGIYMPYWDYQYQTNKLLQFKGSKSKRKGNYIYKDMYDVSCHFKMDYKGVYFDASSTFADHLSECIAPFDVKEEKEFTPAYLSGFYADINDVKMETYATFADKFVKKDVRDTAKNNAELKEYEISDEHIDNIPVMNFRKPKLVLLPVWFLSYRKGDRVSYAVVNGQTGKVAADLPVDMRKYLKSSLIASLLLFVILNFFFTFTPGKLLFFAALLAVGCFFAANQQMTKLIVKDLGLDDYGKISVSQKNNNNSKKKKTGRRGIPFNSALWVCMICSVIPVFWVFLPICVFIIILSASGEFTLERKESIYRQYHWKHMKEKMPVLIKPVLGLIAIIGMFLFHPVFDGWYYLASFVSLVMTGLSAIDLMKYHNRLVSRRLPQLNKRGGDNFE